MKYMAKELLNGPDFPDESRDIEWRECANAQEATKFVEDIQKKGLELRSKRQKKDYDKVTLVEIFFERKNK